MLMFDNAIFASFIPQAIMLLGWISCVLAPFLPSLSYNTPANADDLNAGYEISYEKKAVDTSDSNFIHFYDDLNDQILVNDQIVILFSINVIRAFQFPEIEKSYTTGISFKQFSRPPPAFC